MIEPVRISGWNFYAEGLIHCVPVNRMASSIHAIHRPLARSRRDNISAMRASKHARLPSVSDVEDELLHEEPVLSEDEIEEDFEPMDPAIPDSKACRDYGVSMSLPPLSEIDSLGESVIRAPTRSGSMATVKLERRARLAEKLRDIFDVQGIDEVIAGSWKRELYHGRTNDHKSRDAMLAPSISL